MPVIPTLEGHKTEREPFERLLESLERIASAVETMALSASARVAIETRRLEGAAPDSSSRCDHKFIDSTVCLKCGCPAPKQ